MRIAAGRFRNALLPPAGPGVRPVPSRLRQSLFTVLLPRIEGARVLDLCAGVGGLGLEALSRGAQRVVLVEQEPRHASALARWIEDRHLGPEAAVVRGDARRGGWPPGPYDLVFVDPPFEMWGETASRRGPDDEGGPRTGSGAEGEDRAGLPEDGPDEVRGAEDEDEEDDDADDARSSRRHGRPTDTRSFDLADLPAHVYRPERRRRDRRFGRPPEAPAAPGADARAILSQAIASTAPGGLVVVKLPSRAVLPEDPRWRVLDRRGQGDVGWALLVPTAAP